MKEYQYRWLQKLRIAKRRRDIVSVCKKINSDDSGYTDALTQAVSLAYLNLEEKYTKLLNSSKT